MKRLLPYGAWVAVLSFLAVFILLGPASADERNQVQLTVVNHTASGYIKQGCVGLTLITSSGFTGTLGTFSPAASTTYQIPIPAGSRIGDVYYTVSAGTLTSIEVR